MSFSVRWFYASEAKHQINLRHNLTNAWLNLNFYTSSSFSPSGLVKVFQESGSKPPHGFKDPILVSDGYPID